MNGFTLLPLAALLLTWAALPAAAESNRAAKPNIVFLLAADGAERNNLFPARPAGPNSAQGQTRRLGK